MPERPQLNAVGDLVLTDPQALRALAEPSRLALFDLLRRGGPATVAALSAQLPAAEGHTQAHLEELERFGFVERGDGPEGAEGRWQAVGAGVFFELPDDDPDGQAAARQLSNVMMLQYVDLPRRWIAEVEPRLELEWVRVAGLFNARVNMTAAELGQLQEGLERLMEPFTTRAANAAPRGARPMRLLAYFMPEVAGS